MTSNSSQSAQMVGGQSLEASKPEKTIGETFAEWNAARLAHVEAALSRWVSPDAPAGLGDAMRYSVLGGGKRLRPLLVLAASEAMQGCPAAAMRAACAAELIHAYSLVHDDMPCMDNDVLRRGKPTVHVQFGQARALLAGDALQALAFELLTPSACDEGDMPASVQALLCRTLARAAGHEGMAGGQAIDLAAAGTAENGGGATGGPTGGSGSLAGGLVGGLGSTTPMTEAQLRHMHSLKTGALLRASVMMGLACAPQGEHPDPTRQSGGAVFEAFSRYGWAVGLAFQVVDDILDVVADTATLGKTAGKDAAADKPTYVSVLGLERSRAYAHELHGAASQALAELSGVSIPAGIDTSILQALADSVVERSF